MIRDYPGEKWSDIIVDRSRKKRSYRISSFGRVASYLNDPKTDGRLIKTGLIDGYPAFGYRKRPPEHYVMPGTKSRFVHKLVAIVFIGQPPTKAHQFVLHLDYDKCNNHVSNLQWATKEEVEAHLNENPHYLKAKDHQRNHPEQYASKLSKTDVIRLKKKIFDPNRKTRLRIIAKQFGISEMQLHRIKTGENWSSVTIPEETEYKKAQHS